MTKAEPPHLAERAEIVRRYRRLEEIVPRHWTESRLQANGINQHFYRTGGSKPPAVLLHGIMEGSLSWLRTARELEADYDVIMVDARGHGLSERMVTAKTYTQEVLTEDVAALMHALDLQEVRVVGFSQGAATGIRLADAEPRLVRSLVAAGVGDTRSSQTEGTGTDVAASPGYQAWLETWTSWLRELRTQSHEERMIASLSQLMPGQAVPPEEQYVGWVESAARLDLDLVAMGGSLWASVGDRGQAMLAALGRLSCPVLVMRGGMWPTPGVAVVVKEEPSDRPNVRVVHFQNAGHTIDRECFEPFIHWVKEFLRGS